MNRPDITQAVLTRTVELMEMALPDARVVGFETLIEGLTLPDENDRHVLAVALRAKAEVIVTLNQKDFPASALQRFNIEALHPDDFIADLFDLNPGLALEAVRRQRQSLRHPPLSTDDFLDMLLKQGLSGTVSVLKRYRHAI